MRTPDVAVIGGGIIGTCSALALQTRGHAVTIVEPNEPGAGTAAGSAGYLAWDDIFPIPSRSVVAGLPRMLLDRSGPLVIAPSHLLKMTGWGLRFLAAARPSAVRRAIAALAPLNRLAETSLYDLARSADAQRYLVRETVFHVCRTPKTLADAKSLLPILAAEGFLAEALDGDTLRAQEPALRAGLAGAIAYPGSGRCTNPGAFGAALAQHFLSNGGALLKARATALQRDGDLWLVRTDAQAVRARQLVLAAGAWSGALIAALGYRVPLESARGYHLMLPEPGVVPGRTLLFEEDHFCATPMEEGLRLAGTVEFARLDSPMNPLRADLLYDVARGYLPALRRDSATRWMGNRPSLPDSLPIIAELRRHPGIVAAFGHERRGLTESGITARCVADLIEHRPPPVDVRPFRVERF
ncbi:MAG TPA: FAD-binding oxidoreductase [Candidatus Tyrphobacter sp.]